MKRLVLLSALLATALASASTPSAAEVLAKASASAKKSGKNVLVIFHASWCGWCHKLDDFLDKSEEGKLVKNGLEVVHLTVLESKEKKADENPGAMELLTRWGGDKAGLPFMVILDAKSNKVLADSLQTAGKQSTNTGYPAAKEEVAHFIKMLEKGAKKISKEDRAKVQNWLTANAPKS
jgi:thiol-disulfide isomerase/thioredoxin